MGRIFVRKLTGDMGPLTLSTSRPVAELGKPSGTQAPGKGAELPHLGPGGRAEATPSPRSRLSWVIRASMGVWGVDVSRRAPLGRASFFSEGVRPQF